MKDKKLPDPKTLWKWTRGRLADEIMSASCNAHNAYKRVTVYYVSNEVERARNIEQMYIESQRLAMVARECLNRLREKHVTQGYMAETLALENAREAHARAIEAARTAESYLE